MTLVFVFLIKRRGKLATLYDQLSNMDDIDDFADQRIGDLKELVERAKEELGIWKKIQRLLNTCRDLADKGETEVKKGKLRYKWTESGKLYWGSEVGSVAKKAWGKYEGWPNCLSHLKSDAEDDRSYLNMVHRKARDEFDSKTTDFSTLIDCQLAVEEAHQKWVEKQAKSKKQTLAQ